MTKMTIIETDQLDILAAEIQRLHNRLDQVEMIPKPQWVPINEYAKIRKVSRRTVIRKIEAGAIEAQQVDGERMVRLNQAV